MRLLVAWVQLHLVFWARKSWMPSHHRRQKDYGSNKISRTHNIVRVKCHHMHLFLHETDYFVVHFHYWYSRIWSSSVWVLVLYMFTVLKFNSSGHVFSVNLPIFSVLNKKIKEIMLIVLHSEKYWCLLDL